MPKNLRRIALIVVFVAVIAAGPIAFLDYFLPHHAVLRVVGSEVKRFGTKGNTPNAQNPNAPTHDVYYVYAEDLDSKAPRVFRNEDTGWGFPWYFKFNSADLQATAQSIAGERGTALFTYYGWRIQMLTLMPNVTKIVRAAPDASTFPWFNLVFFTVLIGGITWLFFRVRGLWNWLTSKLKFRRS